MTLSSEFFKDHVESIFIAYSFVYIEDALAALTDAEKKVEAVIVQPYRKDLSSGRGQVFHFDVSSLRSHPR